MLVLASGSALAQESLGRDRTWMLTAFAARWGEARLLEIPYDAVTGQIEFFDSYFVAGAVGFAAVPYFSVPLPFTDASINGFSLELEGQLVQHFGEQDHLETTGAVIFRSPEIPLFGGLSVNTAWGNGLSWAFEDPDFEQGTSGIRGDDTYQLQYI